MKKNKNLELNFDLPAEKAYSGTLPAIVRARGGSCFDPRENLWELREGTQKIGLNFNALPPLASGFLSSFKSTLIWYAEYESVLHLRNMFYVSKSLFKYLLVGQKEAISEITDIDLVNYKTSLSIEHVWYLSALAGFLKRWHALGLTGVSESTVTLLRQIRLKGNQKGVATATMDPVDGPLTGIELEGVQLALNSAYANGKVTEEEFILCWLIMMLGQRPTQYAAMKVRDVEELHEEDGSSSYLLRVPRAKGRNSNPRSELKDRLLTPQIGEQVVRYAAKVKADFTSVIANPLDAPLFPGELIDDAIEGYAYHMTAAQIGNLFKAVMNRLRVVSERTSDFIHIGARRFRSTIGTRAAEEGHGPLVIAELLDHRDTQNVGVYVGATPAIVERLDKAIAMQLAPLAQAFAGNLTESPSKNAHRVIPVRQIHAAGITGKADAMSSCGKHGFCGFLKPIACYTCSNFQPWLDGPHEQVLEYLIAERERLLAAGDVRIASINDRVILAVAEVIQLCEAARNEKGTPHA